MLPVPFVTVSRVIEIDSIAMPFSLLKLALVSIAIHEIIFPRAINLIITPPSLIPITVLHYYFAFSGFQAIFVISIVNYTFVFVVSMAIELTCHPYSLHFAPFRVIVSSFTILLSIFELADKFTSILIVICAVTRFLIILPIPLVLVTIWIGNGTETMANVHIKFAFVNRLVTVHIAAIAVPQTIVYFALIFFRVVVKDYS